MKEIFPKISPHNLSVFIVQLQYNLDLKPEMEAKLVRSLYAHLV
jgi:hypothetical protein